LVDGKKKMGWERDPLATGAFLDRLESKFLIPVRTTRPETTNVAAKVDSFNRTYR